METEFYKQGRSQALTALGINKSAGAPGKSLVKSLQKHPMSAPLLIGGTIGSLYGLNRLSKKDKSKNPPPHNYTSPNPLTYRPQY